MAKCEKQRVSLVAYKEAFIPCNGRADIVEPQTHDRVRVPGIYNMQPRQVRALFGKAWDPKIRDQASG
jgi:hypothetical protein